MVFPFCVNRSQLVFNTDMTDHPSAIQFPVDTDIYFEKEIKHNAIVGPCQNIPFQVHYSPFLSTPNAREARQVILNLSAPYGCSVDACIHDNMYDNIPYLLPLSREYCKIHSLA